jgi:hypothetical protein
MKGSFQKKRTHPALRSAVTPTTGDAMPEVLMDRSAAFYGNFSSEEEAWQAEFESRLASIEKKVAKDGWRELEVLESAGVDRKTMLRFLALVAHEEGDKGWASIMRTQQRSLKSMARRMETLARDAEKRASDPWSVMRTWAFFVAHGGYLGMKFPKPLKDDPGVSFVILRMRTLAKTWKDEAKRFGRFLDFYADRRVNPGVPLLLLRVCAFLRKPNPDHWEELASLLSDAFEAAGKSKRLSADWLRKIWKKRGRRMLLLWLELNTETSPKPTSLPGLAFRPHIKSLLGPPS